MLSQEQLIHPAAPLVEHLTRLNKCPGFLVCIDESNRCVGVLTDGDIRRALMQIRKSHLLS